MDSVRFASVVAVLVAAGAGSSPAPADEPAKRSEARDVARRVDELLLRVHDKSIPLPTRADDASFLRRATLDLTGKIPTPEELRAFMADKDAKKRDQLIERLLKS